MTHYRRFSLLKLRVKYATNCTVDEIEDAADELVLKGYVMACGEHDDCVRRKP